MDQAGLGAIGQVSRKTKDVAKARRWYEEVLGLKHLYTFGTLSFFDLDGTRLFLSEGSGEDSILYLRVDDIHGAAAVLKERGVVFKDQPHIIHRHGDGTEEWMTFFEDCDGKTLALMAQIRQAGS